MSRHTVASFAHPKSLGKYAQEDHYNETTPTILQPLSASDFQDLTPTNRNSASDLFQENHKPEVEEL